MKELISLEFGKTQAGEAATLYTLTNAAGMYISVTDFGATLVKVVVPDDEGLPVDVVLGYDNIKGYETGDVFFGATVGRCANRIGKAAFTLNGRKYNLTRNDGKNNLHSGLDYYNKRMWGVRNKSNQRITFTLHSASGDQGYPGTLDMEVTYELTEDNEIKISYASTPNEDTIINMTNHSYFNLNGHAAGDVLKQRVAINADYYTRADKASIPTGELVEVRNTPMDFKRKKAVGKDIDADYEALIYGKGYDHNWVLNNQNEFRKVAIATGNKSRITMEIYTDLPGMQFYTANFVAGEHGKEGAVYEKRSAMCFETQYFPDAINHKNFQQPICKAGENYNTTTMYKFIAG